MFPHVVDTYYALLFPKTPSDVSLKSLLLKKSNKESYSMLVDLLYDFHLINNVGVYLEYI